MWLLWMTANLSSSHLELIMAKDGWAVTGANQCLLFTSVYVREEPDSAAYLFPSCEEIKATHPEANIRSAIKHKHGQLKKAVCLWNSSSMKMCNINKARAFEKRSLPSWSCYPKGKAHSKLLLNSWRPFCHQTPNCSLRSPHTPFIFHPPPNTAHLLLE